MRRHRFVIVGAGPTGLGAASRLLELGEADFVVLESAMAAGGLARSFRDEQGFTWDLGGHVLFSHYPYFDALRLRVLGVDGSYRHQREAWVRLFGAWVPYPVQLNLRHLPRDVLLRCVLGLVAEHVRARPAPPAHFAAWLEATFGAGLVEVFMRPYNAKVWACPPELMSSSWIGERVAVSDLNRVLTNVLLERDDVSWGPNDTFEFPKVGGSGALWQGLGREVGARHLRFGERVSQVDTTRKVLTLRGGEEVGYDALISTMPVDRLMEMITPRDEPALAAANRLLHSSTSVVGLGLRGEVPDALKSKCWMYFPEDDTPFYRATVFSNYSPAHVPDPRRFWSVMTETSDSPRKPCLGARLVDETISGAVASGLIASRDEVVSVWTHRVEYGYPTPSLDRDAVLAAILPRLEARDVFSRGRFGAWKYEASNQDHSLMQGVELVNRLVLGESETTLRLDVPAKGASSAGA